MSDDRIDTGMFTSLCLTPHVASGPCTGQMSDFFVGLNPIRALARTEQLGGGLGHEHLDHRCLKDVFCWGALSVPWALVQAISFLPHQPHLLIRWPGNLFTPLSLLPPSFLHSPSLSLPLTAGLLTVPQCLLASSLWPFFLPLGFLSSFACSASRRCFLRLLLGTTLWQKTALRPLVAVFKNLLWLAECGAQ